MIMKVLSVRKGYKEKSEQIDLVLFPELSIHVDDIPIVERFADSLKCMVFCGLVFHPRTDSKDKLVNSGLWILPIQTSSGRAIRMVEQGKKHLTPEEQVMGIVSYRPCQWLIEYGSNQSNPQRLSSSICYDATDLRLAADLKDWSDAFIVSALNQDFRTFDAMVTALHYHMYQHVLLVNSAEYGGSTAQAPYKEHYDKVIVHHHGMDQASVSIVDLDLNRFKDSDLHRKPKIKHPPAGIDPDKFTLDS
jgi:hypothetical protein